MRPYPHHNVAWVGFEPAPEKTRRISSRVGFPLHRRVPLSEGQNALGMGLDFRRHFWQYMNFKQMMPQYIGLFFVLCDWLLVNCFFFPPLLFWVLSLHLFSILLSAQQRRISSKLMCVLNVEYCLFLSTGILVKFCLLKRHTVDLFCKFSSRKVRQNA